MKNLNNFFKNILSFQKEEKQDFFLGTEYKFYEIFNKHGEDLKILKDRVLFYNLNTTGIIKSEEGRRGFEMGINILFDILEQNIIILDEKRENDRIEIKKTEKAKIKLF